MASSTVTVYLRAHKDLQDTFQGQLRTKTDDLCVPCTGGGILGQTVRVDEGARIWRDEGEGTLSSTDHRSVEHWRSGEGAIWSGAEGL